MKVLAGIALLVSMVPAMAGASLLWSQNFNSSTDVQAYNATNYTYDVTGDNRLNYVAPGPFANVNTTGNALQLSSVGDGDTAWGKTFSATPLAGIKMQFDVNIALNTALTPGAGIGYFEFGSSGSRWADMAFTVGADGNSWGILEGAGSWTGTQHVTMYLNSSGSATNYIDPNGVEQSLANGFNAVWVGNTLAGNLKYSWNSNPAVPVTGFRYVSPNGWLVGQTTTTFDNFNVQTIPEPATLGLVSIAAAGLLLFRRRFSLMK